MVRCVGLGVRSFFFACLLLLGTFCWTCAGVFAFGGGRVYEMVSPVFKGGYGAAQIEGVTSGGQGVAFFSKGAFAGALSGPTIVDYVARRGVGGWSTAAIMPPASVIANVTNQDVSPSLDSEIALGKPGSNAEGVFQAGTEEGFWLHNLEAPDISANWALAGPLVKKLSEKPLSVSYAGASADLCHLFVDQADEALLPEALGAKEPSALVYELDRGCTGEPGVWRLVGLNSSHGLIRPACSVALGYGQSQFSAVSRDGSVVFFTTGVTEMGGSCGDNSQLFVSLAGTHVLEVSKPVSEAAACGEQLPCPGAPLRAGAEFVGASEDGSTVFFTTKASLTGEDEDVKNDLYMAMVGCPLGGGECVAAGKEVTALVQVSHDLNSGEAADVQGVVRVAPDGSRVYFVARGLLSEGLNAEGQAPVKGADNLYVYERNGRYPAGRTAFVADLCSGPGVSGAAEDIRCPLDLQENEAKRNDLPLWTNRQTAEAQTAGVDGGFLVFSSYGQLVGDDTDNAKDVYRYDAETGALDRVSSGEAGHDANGNCNDGNGAAECDATIIPGHWGGRVSWQYEMNDRAVSEDGSRVVFASSEPLSASAINGLENVYEWRKEPGDVVGGVSLISSGNSEERTTDAIISSAGNDIFFVTSQGLVSQDSDGAPDIYDARVNGGFPVSPVQRQQCSGDACQGPLTNPAPLLVPGSVSQAPGENLAPPAKANKPKKKPPKKKKPKKKAGRRARVSAHKHYAIAARRSARR